MEFRRADVFGQTAKKSNAFFSQKTAQALIHAQATIKNCLYRNMQGISFPDVILLQDNGNLHSLLSGYIQSWVDVYLARRLLSDPLSHLLFMLWPLDMEEGMMMPLTRAARRLIWILALSFAMRGRDSFGHAPKGGVVANRMLLRVEEILIFYSSKIVRRLMSDLVRGHCIGPFEKGRWNIFIFLSYSWFLDIY